MGPGLFLHLHLGLNRRGRTTRDSTMGRKKRAGYLVQVSIRMRRGCFPENGALTTQDRNWPVRATYLTAPSGG